MHIPFDLFRFWIGMECEFKGHRVPHFTPQGPLNHKIISRRGGLHSYCLVYNLCYIQCRMAAFVEQSFAIIFRLNQQKKKIFKISKKKRERRKGPSMSFYSDFISILSRFYPDFIQILSRFYPNFILILSG